MKKITKVARKQIGEKSLPKKYTNNDSGQPKRMLKEVDKFKDSKNDGSAFFQWSGDTNSKTGKRYKTKPSEHTKKFKEKYG